jgi:hypothetical protein
LWHDVDILQNASGARRSGRTDGWGYTLSLRGERRLSQEWTLFTSPTLNVLEAEGTEKTNGLAETVRLDAADLNTRKFEVVLSRAF